MAEATQLSDIPRGMSWFGAFGRLHIICVFGFVVGEIAFLIGFRQSTSWREPSGGHTAITLTIVIGLLLVLFLSLGLTADMSSRWQKLGGLALILVSYAFGAWVAIYLQVGFALESRDDMPSLFLSGVLASGAASIFFLLVEYFVLSGRLRGYLAGGTSRAKVGLRWLALSEARSIAAVAVLLFGVLVALYYIPRGLEILGGVSVAVPVGSFLISQLRKYRTRVKATTEHELDGPSPSPYTIVDPPPVRRMFRSKMRLPDAKQPYSAPKQAGNNLAEQRGRNAHHDGES